MKLQPIPITKLHSYAVHVHVLLQLTYSLMQFAMYETAKKDLTKDGHLKPFYEKVAVAGVAAFCGGFVASQCDLINVRYAEV